MVALVKRAFRSVALCQSGPEKRDLPWPTTPTTTPTTTAMANSNGHYPSEVPARRGTTTSLSPITPANPNNAPATQPDEVSNEILLRGVVPEIEHSSIRAFAEAFGTVLEVCRRFRWSLTEGGPPAN